MRFVVLCVCLIAAACGTRAPSQPTESFGGEQTGDAAVVHPEMNGQGCAQCHTDSARPHSGS